MPCKTSLGVLWEDDVFYWAGATSYCTAKFFAYVEESHKTQRDYKNRRSIIKIMNIDNLFNDLHYFTVGELEQLCIKYGLKTSVPAPFLKKPTLIKAIVAYLTTGQVISYQCLIPQISRAPRKATELTPRALILFGSYRNDLKTRLFMQGLVGPHFYFTVYGHDWIKNRWQQGNPPTYQELANFWQEEYLRRKQNKNTPLKQEWAYLNFMRQYKDEHPQATKEGALSAWKKTREEKVKQVLTTIESYRKF